MFFSSLILSITIALSVCIAWFGLLQTLHCTHRADRLYFVGLTLQTHQQEARTQQLNCSGEWQFNFDKESLHQRRKIKHVLNDWGLPHE